MPVHTPEMNRYHMHGGTLKEGQGSYNNVVSSVSEVPLVQNAQMSKAESKRLDESIAKRDRVIQEMMDNRKAARSGISILAEQVGVTKQLQTEQERADWLTKQFDVQIREAEMAERYAKVKRLSQHTVDQKSISAS